MSKYCLSAPKIYHDMDYSAFLDGICGAAFVSDEHGRVVGWNSAAEKLLGHSKEAVVGMPCREIIRGRDLLGNRFCREDCDLRQSMVRGDPICAFKFAARKASGSYLPVVCVAVAMCEESHCEAFQILHVLNSGGTSIDVLEQVADVARHNDMPTQPGRTSTHSTAILTKREAEVLKLLASGRTTPQVANALSVSVNTIRNHTQNILSKLNAHTRLQAILQAHNQHLI